MKGMFRVRSARALWPPSYSRAFSIHIACPKAVPHPTISRPAPRPASHALLATRQETSAFNQPLSFDTSQVTAMNGMFRVCSARALWPIL